MFASLFAKNILPSSWQSESSDCNEIAHIHNFKTASQPLGSSFKVSDSKKELGDHDDCHAGKSIVSTVMFTSPTVDIKISCLVFSYHPIFRIKSNFQSPHLDPMRKPPRLA